MQTITVCPRCGESFAYNHNELYLRRPVEVTKDILEISKDTSVLDQSIIICQECHEKEMASIKEFVLHVDAWNREGIPISTSDLKKLADKYNCEIPSEYVKKEIKKTTLSVKYDVKIKPEHNPPEFKEGIGKGVVYSIVIDYYPDGMHDTQIALEMDRQRNELLNKFFEVTITDVTEAKKILKENLRRKK